MKVYPHMQIVSCILMSSCPMVSSPSKSGYATYPTLQPIIPNACVTIQWALGCGQV